MSLLRWSPLLLALTFVLVGCKSNSPTTSTQDSGVAAAPAPSKTPALAGPALSYQKPVEANRCAWMRQPLPSGEPTPVATLDVDCLEAMQSWSPNGKEGLVFAPPAGEGNPPRLWRVDFVAKTGKLLDLKGVPGVTAGTGTDKPFIEQVGFDAQSRPVVIVADVYSNRAPEKGPNGEQFITLEGERFPVPESNGTPGLASAYRLEGAEWKRFETKVSSWETPLAPGSNVLDASKALHVPSSFQGEELPGKAASTNAVQLLDAALPGQAEGGKWMSLSTPGGPLHYRGTLNPEDDSLYPSAPLRWEQDGKLVEVAGLTVNPGDRLGLELQGELLLVNVQAEPRSAHVLDTRTKKHLVSVQDAQSVTFWPEPSKP
jgi:hypothetical protein